MLTTTYLHGDASGSDGNALCDPRLMLGPVLRHLFL